jgi:hypothetical protein
MPKLTDIKLGYAVYLLLKCRKKASICAHLWFIKADINGTATIKGIVSASGALSRQGYVASMEKIIGQRQNNLFKTF